MEEEKKAESAITVRGLIVEVLGAISELSVKADSLKSLDELKAKLSEVEDQKEMRNRWWLEESTKNNKLQNEIKELKAKLESSDG